MTQTPEAQTRVPASAARPPAPAAPTQPHAAAATADRAVQFVAELAEFLTRAGEPEGLVQPRVARIAAVYHLPDARVDVLPNLTLASAERGAPVSLDSRAPSATELRLDQMAAVARVARLADRGAIKPEEGLRELDQAKALKHRFGPAGVVAGHVFVALGACLLLQPTPRALIASAGFGTLVGLLKLLARTTTTLRLLMPLIASILVSLLAFTIAPNMARQESLRELIPPLVTFLPGALITSGTLDLVVGHLISGASRLVAGTMQLVLLTLGIAIGAHMAGVSATNATTNAPVNTLGTWAPWLGAIVFGFGCYVHFSGPKHSLGWLLLVLLAAWGGEQLGGRLLSEELGPFVGAFVMTPVAAWIETRPTGPPSLATLMPAYWLLVPGALSLIGVAQFVGSENLAGLYQMINALVAFILIGLGVFVGNSLVLHIRSRRATRPRWPL